MEFGHWARADFARRRQVLRETVGAFEQAIPVDHYQRLAMSNVERWRLEQEGEQRQGPTVRVIAGDWGQVTQSLTREFGVVFAALNMANAYVPGGAYVEGAPAQEENMFRRTDCHFSINESEMDPASERYYPHVSSMLNGETGRVLLDTVSPRVCIRGPEDRERNDLGYQWLPDDEVFPFYELRAAAMDLRSGIPFDPSQARARISAQLETLMAANIRHTILSAFGCGAFRNPAPDVAQIYREELASRRGAFDCVAFAIFHPGYGPDNFTPFHTALK